MPIYDFKCRGCGKVSEFLLSGRSDSRILACPGCGSGNLGRLFSASVMLKEKTAHSGNTCCGRTERCDKPPCSPGGKCRRD